MRAIVIFLFCSLVWAAAAAQTTPTLDALSAMNRDQRADTLRRLLDSPDARAALHDLEMSAQQRFETRRESGIPPSAPGCLTSDEFDLNSQLELARLSGESTAFSSALRDFQALRAALDERLARARGTRAWSRQFPSLRGWERAWNAARNPRSRELLLRTLDGQAIRAGLAREPAALVSVGAKGQRQRVPAGALAPADTIYREYVFNLMCANDEQTLGWFKAQVAEIGWFDQKRYGWAADQAALLIVQHADGDLAFQEAAIDALWPRLDAAETDPESFAYLVDRVAVRTGRPQSFGTQMECVNGAWLAPEIHDLDTLDARRKRMNLVEYDVQLARLGGTCGD